VFDQDVPAALVAALELANMRQEHQQAAPTVHDWIAAATTGQVDDTVAEAPAATETPSPKPQGRSRLSRRSSMPSNFRPRSSRPPRHPRQTLSPCPRLNH
jgi:hypothetical protein